MLVPTIVVAATPQQTVAIEWLLDNGLVYTQTFTVPPPHVLIARQQDTPSQFRQSLRALYGLDY